MAGLHAEAPDGAENRRGRAERFLNRCEVDVTAPQRMLSAQKWGGGQCTFSHRAHACALARASWSLSSPGWHRVVGVILRSRRLTLKTNSNHSTPILRIAALRPNSLNRNSQKTILSPCNGDLSRAHSSMASMRSIFTRCWHQGLSNFGAEEAWSRWSFT